MPRDVSLEKTQGVPGLNPGSGSSLRAVLFADISGSTQLYEKLGDQKALAVIDRCMRIFNHATRMCNGTLIKTIGDEVLVVFPDVPSGCKAAMEMQLGVSSLPESIEYGTSIYVGMHWGEVTLTDGDVFGDTVNVAARMVQSAKRGQIVISGDAVRMLSPDLKGSTRFLGADPVKGKSAPIEMHELLWESDAELTEMVSIRTAAREVPVGLMLTYLGKNYVVNNANPLLTLGRDLASGIVTTDKLASRNHSRISKDRDRFTYTDFSSNGTFIAIEGQKETFVRRDSAVLTGAGTISFGRPGKEEPDSAIRFSISQTFG